VLVFVSLNIWSSKYSKREL